MRVGAATDSRWIGTSLWPQRRKAPVVVVLAGVDRSEIIDAALADTALTEAAVLRMEPDCSPPCDALVWRLETASGASLNAPGGLDRYWHRAPYAMTVRLVSYQPGSAEPEILDEGTLGTRGSRAAFAASVDRLAMRFLRDAVLGRSRGPAGSAPAAPPRGLPGWVGRLAARWHDRLTAEWWSLGSTAGTPDDLLRTGRLGPIKWYQAEAGGRYLADPFPWPGSDRILCEEMPVGPGLGRIVAVSAQDGVLTTPSVVLDDGQHHSYPCTFVDDGTTYCIPESTSRGATRLYRLEADGTLIPLADVAPHARLADPTLFRWGGRYWLACTDLDLGGHDNLCLLHADNLHGPWTPHAKWPVKIDVRSARPAGTVFESHGRLFRPGQDCAATYGAGVALHEVLSLTETDFAETVTTVLRPDSMSPFPHGLHTLVHDGQRFWVDGKRFVFDIGLLKQKFVGRMRGTRMV